MESSSLCAGISATIWPLQRAAEPFISAIVVSPSAFPVVAYYRLGRWLLRDVMRLGYPGSALGANFAPPGGRHRGTAGGIVTGVTRATQAGLRLLAQPKHLAQPERAMQRFAIERDLGAQT